MSSDKSTPTKDLKIGDVINWDYGYKSQFTEINLSKADKTITFKPKSLSDGIMIDRKMGVNTLVAVKTL